MVQKMLLAIRPVELKQPNKFQNMLKFILSHDS